MVKMTLSNSTTGNTSDSSPRSSSTLEDLQSLPVLYTLLECTVAITALLGNLLVIVVFIQDKRLRKRTNFYILSLALSDFLVGLLGIPSAILTRIGIPRDAFHGCLTMLSLLVVLCTISILNLVAVSFDRFWAILFPLNYHQKMSSRAALLIILSCWLIGALIGFLPLFGWNSGPSADKRCLFIPIMKYDFLVFLYFATIVLPALLMTLFYTRIYSVVISQVQTFSFRTDRKESNSSGLQRSHTFPLPVLKESRSQGVESQRVESRGVESQRVESRGGSGGQQSGQSDSRMRVSYCRREVKKAQKLSMIVMFFMFCWFPLYTLNFLESYDWVKHPIWLMDTLIILSHLNSAINPLLYAYHLKDFREAFHRVLCLCILRKQELRDIRRQQLVSVSQGILTRTRVSQPDPGSKLANVDRTNAVSCPTSLVPTPEISYIT